MEAVKNLIVLALVLTDKVLVLDHVWMVQVPDQIELGEVRCHHIGLNLLTIIHLPKFICEEEGTCIFLKCNLNLPNASAYRPDHFDFYSTRNTLRILSLQNDIVVNTWWASLPVP